MSAVTAPGTITDALTRITAILLDLDDQLAHTSGAAPHPRTWAPALDDLHTALVEMTQLAATVQAHHHRWACTNPTADSAALAGTAEAVEALSQACDALTEAARAVGVAQKCGD